ncbi:hypothetical protein DFQ27_008313 [Actinomortierella ambigua]|uniref:Enoyl reductase (ER) domain-containing protein n=1 Tax=Actinomortierella ambigua TaxID=1343610 RepID=A0A9P6PU14_9FUNG|nr:hypothetical protein DFQ26_004427 [Actinomortierella ambigua]KAG0252042.1 hypothetical protein DFQ27_008313 [Actinomortierella ambigua]
MANVALPSTQKAIQYTKFGNPSDVLELNSSAPVPTPGPNEVIIKVHAAALNPVDWKLMKGGVTNFLLPSVMTPGLDVAGTIVAAGTKVLQEHPTNSSNARVPPFKVGDEVLAFLHFKYSGGALKEYTNVDVSLIAHKPASLSFEEAAAWPLVSITDWEALVIRGKIQKGHKVLINGASGGCGTTAVQLAKAFGAHVVGVCSTRNVEFVKQLGADEVVDYTKTKVWEQFTNQDFDIVYDTASSGAELWQNEAKLLKRDGVYVSISESENTMSSFKDFIGTGASLAARKVLSFFHSGPSVYLFTAFPSGALLRQVVEKLMEGDGDKRHSRPVIDSVHEFTLDGVHKAFEQSKSRRARGKIVVKIV